MDNCIFCKIIANEIPAQVVYEDSFSLAFLDINPINRGHVLVVPKEHYRDFNEASVEVLKNLIRTAKLVAETLSAAVGADGFIVSTNNGRAAGQEVMHLHFHVIPRFNDDHLHAWPGRQYKDEQEIKYVADSIIRAIKKEV
jgi:histidine triad (HIT) family protein